MVTRRVMWESEQLHARRAVQSDRATTPCRFLQQHLIIVARAFQFEGFTDTDGERELWPLRGCEYSLHSSRVRIYLMCEDLVIWCRRRSCCSCQRR